MQSSKRTRNVIHRCVLETLERRQLLSTTPAPSDSYTGPLTELSDPQKQYVSPGSPPTATLAAQPLTGDSNISYSFRVIYRDDAAVRASSIDHLDVRVYGSDGFSSAGVLMGVDDSSDGPERVARYKIAPRGGSWDAADNGSYSVVMRPSQVFDVHGLAVNAGTIGTFDIKIPGTGTAGSPDGGGNPAPPSDPPQPPGGSINFGVDVGRFGAIPNDGIDDTDAIQRAIDSLPRSDGAPSGEQPAGGIVLLSEGVYDISRSLRLHSGVTLRGSGVNTVLHDVGMDRNHSAILLYSPFSHRFNIAASVESLTIYTRWGGGISVASNVGDITDLRLADLRISSLGPAIDLRNSAVYHSDIDNVEVYNPGSAALRIGRRDGFAGADVRVRDFRVTGIARSGFRTDQPGMVVLVGDTLVQRLSLSYRGTGSSSVVPLYVTGMYYTSSASGSTMYQVDIRVPTADLPGTVAAQFQDVSRVTIDRITGIGMQHKLKLVNAHDVQIGSISTDGTTNVVRWMVARDTKSSLRIADSVGGLLRFGAAPQTEPRHTPVPPPTTVIDATAFGVIPDDGLDDTAALQAAIDSLPRGNGIPGSGDLVGGIVQLPLGAINTSQPIKLPSGVWLRGHNNGTVIRNTTTSAGRGIIEFTSPYAHRSNIGAGLVELGLYSTAAAGIRADSTISGELRDLRLVGLKMRTAGPAIDLRSEQVNHALLDRIVVTDAGTIVIGLGRDDNSSVGNHVRGVRITGRLRDAFRVEAGDRALFSFWGDTTIEGGTIGDYDSVAPIIPFYASGRLTLDGLWVEYPPHPSKILFLLDNVQANIDRLYHVSPRHRVHLINSSDVRFRSLNIDGTTAVLRDTVSVDNTSRLTLDTVNAQWDSGMLDHPRVVVKGFYNERADYFVETAATTRGTNLIADPDFTSVSDDIHVPADWQIVWRDGYSGRAGNWSVETVSGVARLRVEVTEPTYFHIRVRTDVPNTVIGGAGLASWRIDGPGQPVVYTRDWATEYAARASGSLTAARTPTPFTSNNQIWIGVGSPSQLATAGIYYFWKFGLVAT